ncbi:type II toxin-antitoxin system RelE/ParE family toxin [Xanthomonas arboricola]|uniref:type II toxin-antitoxin system RelE/ParE family toxin n=1 Tax=Xanthomonas arboricola TaxID=56448 RepID=UPI00161D0ED3|nr:type II toxin-antitoxin system RelE/ParE family toxin [Xanthomonas arboricola]MBB5862390.1 phage-related protein [Xanthomonas arboricola]
MHENDTSSKSSPQGKILDLGDKAVQRDMNELPEAIQDRFIANLRMVLLGLPPVLRQEKLHSAGEGVIELKINGRPAYRCMYAVAKNGDVVVLHATSKTAQGQDKQLVKTTAERFKRLMRGR